MPTHPCLWAVCWHCWWWTDKVRRYRLHPLPHSDSSSLNWRPPTLKTLRDKQTKENQHKITCMCEPTTCTSGSLWGFIQWPITVWAQSLSYLRSWRALESAHLGWDPGSCTCRPPHTERCMAQNAHSLLGAETDGKKDKDWDHKNGPAHTLSYSG